MKIQSLQIQNFTVFKDQAFDFCDGINVFIGANSTGKSHALKAMYWLSSILGIRVPDPEELERLEGLHRDFVSEVFRPADYSPSRLIRRAQDGAAHVTLWGDDERVIESDISRTGVSLDRITDFGVANPLFFPSREMLSVYKGFAATYDKREMEFDKTHYDVCRHLEVPLLKRESLPAESADLIRDLTEILGGSVQEEEGRFYVEQPNGKRLEAHLLAEGYRKVAMLVRLIANGEIGKDTILFWDEPESSLNPRLITQVAKTIRKLAAAGVQVFLATHDYLLTGELSLAAEYEKSGPPTRFFSLYRKKQHSPVSVETGNSISDLQHNPILEEFAAHYDRGRDAFYKSAKAASE